ncbi:MAG: TolC family protein [Planctomycetota bacterium]
MCCQPPKLAVVLLCVAAILTGCAPQQPLYLRNNGDLSHYIGMSQTIDSANVPEPPFSEVEGTIRPFSIARPAPKDHWDLSLENTIRYALQNAKVMRSIGGQVQGPPTFLTANPMAAPTIYDPAIVETDPRFGINAGLSLFDPQWNTDLFWERNHEPRNVNPAFGSTLPQELSQDLAQFQTALSKTTADGTVLSVSNSTSYDLERDNGTRRFPSDWQTSFQMEIRRPLLQGYGVEFNRIAGPGAIPGFNQGVLIARVNTDIALATFEAGVRNLVSDVEIAYWELYFAYRNLDTAVQGRDSALQTWQKVYALYIAGAKNGEAASEAQAREQYFLFRSTAEQALSQLYQTESKLRYMMGIAATDGRLIRPTDDPTAAKISFDWSQVQSEAMARSVEIRESRWRVKQRELELIAAKNYLLPRVDLDARYRWLGLGDKLIDQGNSDITGGAFDNLASGRFQDWHLGVSAQIPIGFRKQKDGVTNAELAVARDRAKLRETELEVSHQVAYAIRDMEANLVLTATNFNRRLAAQRNVEAVQAAYQNGQILIDVLLNAQRTLAQAESDYFRSVTNYAKSISQVHFRKGSLLEYNGVYLTEGPWPAKAYFDARRRARSRSAALYLDYGFTSPKAFSRGPNPQFTGQVFNSEEIPTDAPASTPGTPKQPSDMGPEVLPAPQPSGKTPSQRPSAPQDPLRPESTATVKPPRRGTYDIGSLDLSSLATKADAAAAASNHDPAVQPAGYHDLHELGKDRSIAERLPGMSRDEK